MKYHTPIGDFDGDAWEELCQFCLKTKFGGNYIEVPASPGDYGIDGFNLDGEIFQCQCPEKEATDKELYENQRNKINKDIKKLKLYEKKLCELFSGYNLKIQKWHLLTPLIKQNDLLFYCNEKAKEVLSWNLPFIDNINFKIIPIDYQYLAKELPYAYNILDYTTSNSSIIKRIENKTK